MIIQFEKRDRIALITLNRPEARNAVNHEVAEGIENALDEFENEKVMIMDQFIEENKSKFKFDNLQFSNKLKK